MSSLQNQTGKESKSKFNPAAMHIYLLPFSIRQYVVQILITSFLTIYLLPH